MVLAMPVQAFAAATMLFCGPAHERMFGAVSATPHGAAQAAGHGGHHAGHADHPVLADAAAAPDHHASMAHDHGAQAAMTHGGGDHAGHHPPAVQGASDADTTPDATPGTTSASATDFGSTSFSCSACAACCSMLALPVSVGVVGAAERVDTVASSPVPEVHWFVTDTLERPPRALLA
jgi:hypothetical protein